MGSRLRKVVESLRRLHHVLCNIKALIMDYYNSFYLRFTSPQLHLSGNNHCTISAILYALAMNMLVKSAQLECRGPKTKSLIRQPPIRAFMDDLTVTTVSDTGCRWIL